jgi:hypothetical protein
MPSWSWASIEASINYDNNVPGATALIQSWSCTYDPPDSILAVKEAWLEIYASISTRAVWAGPVEM